MKGEDKRGAHLTPERARELRASQLAAPRRLHGMKEVRSHGRLRCVPEKCPKRDICPEGRKGDDERARDCAMLALFLALFERNIRRATRVRAAEAPLLAIIIRREAMLFAGELWFSEEPAFYREGTQIIAQPAVALYAQLLAAQARDLGALGVRREGARPDPGALFADALNDAIDATPRPRKHADTATAAPGAPSGPEGSPEAAPAPDEPQEAAQ